jgi:hypothetical protein
MPTFKLLFLMIVSLDTFAQVKVDKSVVTRYKTLFKKMDSSYQQKVTQLENDEPFIGISIFTTYQTDTLNRQDVINYGNDITIEDVIPNLDNIKESVIDENIYTPVFSRAELIKDTLYLSIGGPLSPNIKHKIHLRQVISQYDESYKYDSVLRLDLTDTKVSKLSIPIKTKKFLISTSSYNAGQVIYGQVEFETVPYYFETLGFKNNYIKKRLRCVYFFKVRVKKNST